MSSVLRHMVQEKCATECATDLLPFLKSVLRIDSVAHPQHTSEGFRIALKRVRIGSRSGWEQHVRRRHFQQVERPH